MGGRLATDACSIALAGVLAAACASAPRDEGRSLVVVVPETGGRVGTVAVNPGPGETRLDSPYAAARVSAAGVERTTMSEAEVRRLFADALAARPLPPVSFTLYFIEGRDEFTAESKRVVDAVFAEIAKREAAEIAVIGHTDRVGTHEYNDALSAARAQRVRGELIQRGIAAQRIFVSGRGEREPVVPTEDEVAEPRNRRVEINVR